MRNVNPFGLRIGDVSTPDQRLAAQKPQAEAARARERAWGARVQMIEEIELKRHSEEPLSDVSAIQLHAWQADTARLLQQYVQERASPRIASDVVKTDSYERMIQEKQQELAAIQALMDEFKL